MSLNDDQRFAIREMRRVNPTMRYRQIASLFNVTISAVEKTLNANYMARPGHEPKSAPKVPVEPYSSFIRPIPLHRLMAGRA